MKKLKTLEQDHGAHIVFAHDAEWMKAGEGQTLMSLLSDEMKEFTRTKLHADEPY